MFAEDADCVAICVRVAATLGVEVSDGVALWVDDDELGDREAVEDTVGDGVTEGVPVPLLVKVDDVLGAMMTAPSRR